MLRTIDWASEGGLDRQRLVRLCGRLTGSFENADDLAQQVLLEAWLHEGNLRDPDRAEQWLNGVARNVCKRWIRANGRALKAESYLEDEPDDDCDVELELERDELADLLDRALGMLRPEERALLIAHYIEGLPRTELADQLGLLPGTLAVRLHRGRMALRRVLSQRLRDDAASFGLPTETPGEWVPTELWCYLCGGQRMHARLDPAEGWLHLRCDSCCRAPNALLEGWYAETLGGATRVGTAHRRAHKFHQRYGWQAIRDGSATCIACGSDLELRNDKPFPLDEYEFPALNPGDHGAFCRCPGCGRVANIALRTLVFGLPEMQVFWKKHPRLRLWPEQSRVEEGRHTLVVGAQSVSSDDTIEVRCSPDDYSVLGVKLLPERDTNTATDRC